MRSAGTRIAPDRFRIAVRKWELGPIAITLLSLLLAAALIWQLEALVTASARVDHSDRVIAQTHQLEKGIVDLETGLRGFVITGSDSFLEPYSRGRRSADADLTTLSGLVQGEPAQLQRIGEVRARLNLWLEHSERVLAAQRAGGQGAQVVAQGNGKRLVDGMRAILGQMADAETRLRDAHSSVAVRRAAVIEIAAVGSLLLLGAFLAVALLHRRRWRAALEASERRFHALTDQLSEYAAYVIDPNGEVASWNAGARRMKGYSAEEIIGKNVSVLYTQEDARAGLPGTSLREAAEKGQFVFQAWHVRKDGSRFWADVVLTALHDEQGRLCGFSKVTRDLTERKQAEDRILAAEARLRVVLETAYDAILVANGEGQIEFANRAAQNALGYAGTELEGKPFGFILSDEDRQKPELTAALAPAEDARPRGVELEVQARRKDGREFPVAMTLSPTPGPLGSSALVTAIFRDVSEARRRSAQQWLLAELGHELSKSFDYETVFRTIAELVVPTLGDWAVVDLQFEDGEVARLAVVHGDPRKQELARRFHERYLRVPVGSEGVLRVMKTGKPVLVEDRGLERARGVLDDESYALLRELGMRSYVIVPLQARGRTLGALTLVASDRSLGAEDLRFAEEIALRASLLADNARLFQRATEEARLREDLMAIVSHDLRNPIHAIRLNAQVLEKVVSQMPAEGGSYHDKLKLLAVSIERAVDQGNRLITDLLDSAKIESGTFTGARAPTLVRDLVEDALEMLRPIAAEKGISVETQLASEVVPCDHERIVQVLSNLLGNAIKFTPRGGSITVQADRIDSELRVGVRDTGRGIPADVLPHVFDRYWQGQAARRGGAGLGLSIAKGIVEAHGGHIWAESAPDAGSTFWFALPLTELALAQPAEERTRGAAVQEAG